MRTKIFIFYFFTIIFGKKLFFVNRGGVDSAEGVVEKIYNFL